MMHKSPIMEIHGEDGGKGAGNKGADENLQAGWKLFDT
jgi:hypothetical protein